MADAVPQATEVPTGPPPPAPDQAARGLGKLILQYVPGQILPSVLTFLAVPLLTRSFGEEAYGYYVLLYTLLTTLQMFGFLWVSNCALRFYRPMEDRKPVFFLHLLLGYGLTLALLGGAVAVSWPWLSDKYRSLFLLAAPLAAMLGLVHVLSGVLRAQGRALHYSLMMGLNAVVRYGPGLAVIALVGASVRGFVGAWTVGAALNAVLLVVLTGALGGLLRARPDRAVLRQFAAYGLPIMVVGATSVAMSQSDRFLIDYYLSLADVGIYGVAFQLGGVPISLIGSTLLLAVLPRTVDAFEAQDNYQAVLRKGLRYLLLGSLAVLVLLWVVAEPLLEIYAGEGFGRGAMALRLITLATVVQGTAQYYRIPFMVHQRTGVLVVIGAVSAAVGLVANVLLLPRLGIVGSGWALLAAYGTMLLCSVVLSMRLLGVGCWPVRATLRAMGAAVAACLAAMLLMQVVQRATVAGVATIAVATAAVYGLMLYATGEIRPEVHHVLRRLRTLRSGR